MRQKRAKAYRKLMALYSMTFGFRQPYQVLIDSEMCKSATDLKIELTKQLSIVLQGTVKPMITQCCIHELYLEGKSQQPAVDLAKTFERRKCNHREPIPGGDCLTGVVGDTNKHRYVIATQSQPLRIKLRSIPAVPIVHVNRSVMVLEPPSDTTVKTKEAVEEQALHPTPSDLALVPTTTAELPRKKNGPKGPNPMSVKKKKKHIDVPAVNAKGEKDKHVASGSQKPYSEVNERTEVGEKRKRHEENLNLRDGTDPAAHTRRKRKRRRKTAGTQ